MSEWLDVVMNVPLDMSGEAPWMHVRADVVRAGRDLDEVQRSVLMMEAAVVASPVLCDEGFKRWRLGHERVITWLLTRS